MLAVEIIMVIYASIAK